jgi:hypothetical protein
MRESDGDRTGRARRREPSGPDRLWPHNDQFGTYTYDQIRCAAWTFRDWNTWLDKSYSTGSKAIYFGNMVRWLLQYHDKRIGGESPRLRKAIALVATIGRLQMENPKGQCVIPCDPKREGEWG